MRIDSRLAEVALQGDRNGDWYEWFQFAGALHAYRSGRYAETLAACRASRARISTTKGNTAVLASLDLVLESMALHDKGDLDGARRTLDQARSLVEGQVPGLDSDWWQDWLIAHILFREAKELIAVDGDQVLQIVGREIFLGDHELRIDRHQADRLKILLQIVIQLVDNAADMGVPLADVDRVAVGRRTRDTPDRNAAAGAANILDDDRLPEGRSHALGHDARGNVG